MSKEWLNVAFPKIVTYLQMCWISKVSTMNFLDLLHPFIGMSRMIFQIVNPFRLKENIDVCYKVYLSLMVEKISL